MAKKIMTDKHKIMCYLLVNEFGRTQQKIADLFEVSQSTISSAIKDASYLIQIESMQKALNEAREELLASGMALPSPLDNRNIIDI